jgi:hypothetical protein
MFDKITTDLIKAGYNVSVVSFGTFTQVFFDSVRLNLYPDGYAEILSNTTNDKIRLCLNNRYVFRLKLNQKQAVALVGQMLKKGY